MHCGLPYFFVAAGLVVLALGADAGFDSALMFANSSGTIFFTLNNAR